MQKQIFYIFCSMLKMTLKIWLAALTSSMLMAACTQENHKEAKHNEDSAVTQIQPDTVQQQKSSSTGTVAEQSLDSYCNARFKYCIDYPANLLTAQPESDNGDGRIFTDKDGTEVLRVYGSLNINDLTVAAQFKKHLSGNSDEPVASRKVTYQRLLDSSYVISGIENEKFFYQRTILKDGAFVSAICKMDSTKKDSFSKLSKTIFSTFK